MYRIQNPYIRTLAIVLALILMFALMGNICDPPDPPTATPAAQESGDDVDEREDLRQRMRENAIEQNTNRDQMWTPISPGNNYDPERAAADLTREAERR